MATITIDGIIKIINTPDKPKAFITWSTPTNSASAPVIMLSPLKQKAQNKYKIHFLTPL